MWSAMVRWARGKGEEWELLASSVLQVAVHARVLQNHRWKCRIGWDPDKNCTFSPQSLVAVQIVSVKTIAMMAIMHLKCFSNFGALSTSITPISYLC